MPISTKGGKRMCGEQIQIGTLMQQSGVKFGTSGARGLADAMGDRVCYAYTLAFLQSLQQREMVAHGDTVAIAGDFRPSTPRIMAAVAMAIEAAGLRPLNCGFIPTPAVAAYAMAQGIAAIMVTGSHIPDDRNGIKFYRPDGEILKDDEAHITSQRVKIPDDMFGDNGQAATPYTLPPIEPAAATHYQRRYTDCCPDQPLSGFQLGVYQHSSVARDLLVDIFRHLGADVTPLGRSETFIPVDTEAIRDEDVALARQWSEAHHFDAIISADGDGDRPLISDEHGCWLRGDVAGILCARYLQAQVIATPVSCNSAVELCGWFQQIKRTRIGSPYVIEAMAQALAAGHDAVVGYEANGGFLTATPLTLHGHSLDPLPTRDAVIVPLAILLLAKQKSLPISQLIETLPQRFTYSGRLKNFPTSLSQAQLSALHSSDHSANIAAAEQLFGEQFGAVTGIDHTDGVRITFASGEIAHLRPSGNAPELRCYNEAGSHARAEEMNRICLAIAEQWRSKHS